MLETLILLILLAALTLYAVLGGADFGAGVWEFNTAFTASERERDLLYHAIGPVWETNHVWLIFVLVLLFGAFPPAFAAMTQALFVPLLFALVGIVFRGAAYAFRSQFKADPIRSRVWVVTFALASVFAPLFLGAAVGAIASGQMEFTERGEFAGSYASGWINGLSIFCGFFTVGMCAYTSATYMIRESKLAGQEELVFVWRTRALVTGVIMGVLAVGGLVLVAFAYPELWQGLFGRSWWLILASIGSGLFSLWAIFQVRVNLAMFGATITCSTVVIGWGLAQYPYLMPPFWTVSEAASPESVLELILIATAVGSVFLVPGLWLLFKIFKAEEVVEVN